MSNDFTYEIDSNEIPFSDIKKHPFSKEKIAFNNNNLIPSTMDIVLDNTDRSVYDDRFVGSMFYGVDFYGDEVTIYDNILNIYLYKGLVKSIEVNDKDRSLTVKTANYIQNLKANCVYTNTSADLTVAGTIYNILTGSSMGNIPVVNIDSRSFQKVINIQTSAGVYVYIDYTIEDNKQCLDVINELLRISHCQLYMYNNKIYVYQWQAWNGKIGEAVEKKHILPNSYSHSFDVDNVYNATNVVYQSGANIAYYTAAVDIASQAKFGYRSWNVPDETMESTTAADFKIRFKNSTAAAWAGGLAISKFAEMQKYFSIDLNDELRYLRLSEQCDLSFYPFVREPGRITEIEYDRENKKINLKGLFLNTPYEFYSRDDEAPEAPELISIVPGTNSLTINWTISGEADYLGYKIYFTSTRGEWEVEICNKGISPVDIKNPSTISGYNTLTIYELNTRTEYFVKVRAYDTSYNISDDSNIESGVVL